MPRTSRPWLPTTPGQSAVVYTLTVLFMLNTTVLMLLVSGELSPDSNSPSRALADAMPVSAPVSVEPALRDQIVIETPVVVIDEIQEQAEAFVPEPRQLAPAPVIQRVNEPVVTEPPVAVEPQQPEPEAPPIQFFGLDVD